jgi:hypothetical protein
MLEGNGRHSARFSPEFVRRGDQGTDAPLVTAFSSNVPVASIDPDKAASHFGWLGAFFGVDVPASSHLTQSLLDWEPAQPRLVDDLEKGHYFDG